jgi:hypothetical protein
MAFGSPHRTELPVRDDTVGWVVRMPDAKVQRAAPRPIGRRLQQVRRCQVGTQEQAHDIARRE